MIGSKVGFSVVTVEVCGGVGEKGDVVETGFSTLDALFTDVGI